MPYKDPVKRRARAKIYKARYRATHHAEITAYNAKAANRAYRFLHNWPDCTSTLDEIVRIYDASIDSTTGKIGRIGRGAKDLVLDHIHGGPAIGLIPMWLNLTCSRHADDNLDVAIEYLRRRQELIRRRGEGV